MIAISDLGVPPEQFWAKVEWRPGAECWPWGGSKESHGYGWYSHHHKALLAHRVAYTLAVGPIPEGMVIDHLCRNRACVNPAHMEVVTVRENGLRGETLNAENLRKTHCKRGHPLDGDNLIVSHRPHERRDCRECQRIRHAEGYRRRLAREAAHA